MRTRYGKMRKPNECLVNEKMLNPNGEKTKTSHETELIDRNDSEKMQKGRRARARA